VLYKSNDDDYYCYYYYKLQIIRLNMFMQNRELYYDCSMIEVAFIVHDLGRTSSTVLYIFRYMETAYPVITPTRSCLVTMTRALSLG